jgi:hypothetical protein
MAIDKIESAGLATSTNQPNFRNIIINGDMSIAQRGTSASSVTSTSYNTVDRWNNYISSLGTWTISQDTTVPTGQGFAKSLKYDCTTADASPASNDVNILIQRFEGQNLQYLKKGTSSAESLTLSFWVRSNKTGTYTCEIYDGDNSRFVSKTYSISSADTWEKKTITFDGDTTGALDNDNANSLNVHFWLGAGTDFTGGTFNNGTWSTTTNTRVSSSQVNLADSTSNEWYITGVQLEVGTSASDFEFLPFDINEKRCLRYFEHSYNRGTAPADGRAYGTTITTYQGTVYSTGAIRVLVRFQEPKRTTPSATFYYVTGLSGGTTANRWEFWNGSSWVQSSGTTNAGEIEEKGMDINLIHSGLTIGNARLLGGGWSVDAEL